SLYPRVRQTRIPSSPPATASVDARRPGHPERELALSPSRGALRVQRPILFAIPLSVFLSLMSVFVCSFFPFVLPEYNERRHQFGTGIFACQAVGARIQISHERLLRRVAATKSVSSRRGVYRCRGVSYPNCVGRVSSLGIAELEFAPRHHDFVDRFSDRAHS